MAEREEVDDLIDSSQKLIPPEVSLQSQIRGELSDEMGVKAITGPQWRRYGGFHSFRLRGFPHPMFQWEGQRPLTFRMGRITFSLKFFDMVILSLIWTSPVETES